MITWLSIVKGRAAAGLAVFFFIAGFVSTSASAAIVFPPPVEREFRGVWIASVGNINWPSKPGLPAAEQKKELLAILDRAVELHLNAVVFQARPATETLYESKTEPWSEYLTGGLGKSPGYDPLAFAIDEAHKRGLELHAWFNPYRVRHTSAKSGVPSSHLSKTQPSWVRKYGNQLWLDPGEVRARDYTLNAVFDLVQRYDIDGIHYDDYFYPYPEKDSKGRNIDFPDDTTWKRYQKSGGKLSRDDWRRDNVNQFVKLLYEGVKQRKRSVKVGISPFGIWRPGYPPQIKGLDAYAVLYGDARLWLAKGWCDYFTPQLYWAVDQTAQSYPVLLNWWASQNTQHRHLWAGNNVAKVSSGSWKSDEILRQIKVTRDQKGASGNVFFGWGALAGGISLGPALLKQAYAAPAIPPASEWLDSNSPGRPQVQRVSGESIAWQATGEEEVWLWVVQWRRNGRWESEVLPRDKRQFTLPSRASGADLIAVTAVDRCGNTSLPSVAEMTK